MNAPPRTPPAAAPLLGGMAMTAANHFAVTVFSAAAQILLQDAADGGKLAQAHPFLASYGSEISARLGGAPLSAWHAIAEAWSAGAGTGLPLRRLQVAGLSALEIEILAACGLPEEDPRFGDLFEEVQGRGRRPSLALLVAWWRRGAGGADRADQVRLGILRLIGLGLLKVGNPQAPRADWHLEVMACVWDAIRGDPAAVPGLVHRDAEALPALPALILDTDTRIMAEGLTRQLAGSGPHLVLLRGPSHSGRSTLGSALARSLGLGVLAADEGAPAASPLWQMVDLMAVARGAMPLIRINTAPGEDVVLPAFALWRGPVAVVAGPSGSIALGGVRPCAEITTGAATTAERLMHWRCALPDLCNERSRRFAERYRLGAGAIHRVAEGARRIAALRDGGMIAPSHVQEAVRNLHGTRLEAVASRLPSLPRGGLLCLDEETQLEIEALLARCRHRETLASEMGDPSLAGVRALLAGPSGTGKTHAARMVARDLGKDVYRIDLAATVSKYIGETEKNLDRAFAAAADMDAILLLDEGDALMAGRTAIASANDRYANLETNFLLQRMETHSGILLVTTNAADRIDKAFSRRMDMTIAFRLPDEAGRYAILCQFLGPHEIADDLLVEVAYRCALSGAELRAVALQTRVLALEAGTAPCGHHLLAALFREYRKRGGHCPLDRPSLADSG